jgi:hypothetical protein
MLINEKLTKVNTVHCCYPQPDDRGRRTEGRPQSHLAKRPPQFSDSPFIDSFFPAKSTANDSFGFINIHCSCKLIVMCRESLDLLFFYQIVNIPCFSFFAYTFPSWRCICPGFDRFPGQRCTGVRSVHRVKVQNRLWFSSDAAGYIKEKIWHESQEIHTQKDGSIIFEAEVAGTDEIKFWIMSWGSKAEVLEPESLRDEILREAEVMLERYKKIPDKMAEERLSPSHI